MAEIKAHDLSKAESLQYDFGVTMEMVEGPDMTTELEERQVAKGDF
jgi:hypothetical protein